MASFSVFYGIWIVLTSLKYGLVSSLSGWTYRTTSSTCEGTNENPCGPLYWGEVHGAGECSLNSQSPIDISNVIVKNLTNPTFTAINSGCSTWIQFSNNYTFEIGLTETGYTCTNLQISYAQQSYVMQQIHFHSPSEHTIGGGYYSAEAHLVHKSTSTGETLVVGIPLQVSADSLTPSNNSFLQLLWNSGGSDVLTGATTEISNSPTLFNPYATFLPGRFATYRYNGSLTTPPCTEGVSWFVYDEPVMISQDDLWMLRKAVSALKTTIVSENGNNNRNPTKPINGRLVYYVPDSSTTSTNNYYSTNQNNNDDNSEQFLQADALSITAIVISFGSIVISAITMFWAYKIQEKLRILLLNEGHGIHLQEKIPSQNNPMNP